MSLPRLFRIEHHPHIPHNRRLQVFQISDIHLGSKTHIKGAFQEMVDKIRKTRFTAWIGHGDLIENNSKTSVGEGVTEQKITSNDQLLEIIDILKPISNKCLGLARGNHEARTSKKEGIDIVDLIAKSLDVPRLMSHSLHTFVFDDTNTEHTLLVTHGKTGAGTTAGRRRAVENLTHIYDADAYMYGHVHGLDKWDVMIHGPRYDRYRHYAVNGSFMAYLNSYAQEGEYRFGIPGYMTAMVGRDDIEFIENRIPWPHVPIVRMDKVKI